MSYYIFSESNECCSYDWILSFGDASFIDGDNKKKLKKILKPVNLMIDVYNYISSSFFPILLLDFVV